MMKSKSTSLKTAIIYCCSIVFLLGLGVIFIFFYGNEPRPEIDFGEFPFQVVYEIEGNEVVIEDTIVIKYSGTDRNMDRQTPYKWESSLESGREHAEVLNKLGYDNGLVLYTGELDDEMVYSVLINLGNNAYYMGYLSDEYMPGNVQVVAYDPNSENGTTYHFHLVQESDLEAMCGFKMIKTSFSIPLSPQESG